MAMEAEEERGTLLRRVLIRAARAARAAVRIAATTTASSPSSPAPAAALSRTPSLLDCMDGDDDSIFYTPASSPVVVVHYPRRAQVQQQQQPSLSPSPVAAAAAAADDIDRRAAEFIERFRRNESLELRYCAVYSPLTPAKPPISPDTYFKLSGAHHHGAVAAGGSPAPYVRKMSSLRPRRPSGMSIKWPTAGRPTVRV
ncbi:hypothetical protein OsI_28408 [Oryza sativa Indica Group]|uniref:Uncharacterized protein n=1 Tax=Oryza sativa subsp. indica TaxID=39946 RepID=B8B8P0_ORYSI|nr:hypothetical protein OsI_28408 [Oryza sativa Indica Group]